MGKRPLVDRVRELANEALEERQALDARKAALRVERDESIERIRNDYVSAVAEIDAEIRQIEKLQRALSPEAQKRAANRKDTSEARRKQAWRPSAETMHSVLAAMSDGKETVSEIEAHDAISVSRGTVDLAVSLLRDEGQIRLAGSTGGKGAARRYKLTPQGREALEHTSNGRVTVEPQA